MPVRLQFSKDFQLQPASGTQHKTLGVAFKAFGQKNSRHALKIMKAGHHAHRAFGIACNCFGV